MLINPRDVASRISACPKCGERHYTYVMREGLPLTVHKIRCAHCGTNILRAYRRAQPAGFGLTVGQLDRFALAVGVMLLIALAAQHLVSR
jgi:hypothetical protein